MIRHPGGALAARALKPVVAGLRALHYPADAILSTAGIRPADFADPDATLPSPVIGRFWQAAEQQTADPHVGIHAALAAPVSDFDVHGYALLSSATLREGYRRACRYQRLINTATTLTLDEQPDEGILRHARRDGSAVSRHPAEFLLTIWLRLGRLVTSTNWQPVRVLFAHGAPEDRSRHQEVFGPGLRFTAGQNALAVDAATLDLPNPRADRSLAALLDRYSESLLPQHPATDSTTERLRHWLESGREPGDARAAAAARALAMSERSLHRRLAAEGLTFRAVVDTFRKQRALTLLTSSRLAIGEIAFLLGYSELSAFYRAFRRWTGRSPAEVRTAQ